MEKLSRKNIEFIDRYLKKSGVEFLDIRIEMTDHVASAIENDLSENVNADFYSAFKKYMVRNKKNLLKNAKRQRWSVDLKVLKEVRIQLFKAPSLLLGVGFSVILGNVNIVQLEENLLFQLSFLILFLGAYFVPIAFYSKLKISFLNRLSIYAYIVNYLFYLLLKDVEPSFGWLLISYSLLVWVNCGIILAAFKLSAFYKKQYSEV